MFSRGYVPWLCNWSSEPPTDDEVAQIVLTVSSRVERMFEKELNPWDDAPDDESAALAFDLPQATRPPLRLFKTRR